MAVVTYPIKTGIDDGEGVKYYSSFAVFPGTGELNILYIDKDLQQSYLWDGSAYDLMANSVTTTDSVPEGSTNLYFTNARADARIAIHAAAGDPHTQYALDSELSAKLGESFEAVSKNLKAWDAAFNYSGGNLSTIIYTSGANTITKTFNYSGGNLTSLVLSGDTPSGIELTKTFSYSGAELTGVSSS